MHRLSSITIDLRKILTVIAVAIIGVFILSACGSDTTGDAQNRESKTQQSNYERLQKAQPAVQMPYSPTRDTVKKWISTWGKPNKVSYVYLQNNSGTCTGYYVLKGLPVSYGVSLTPNYKIVTPEIPGDNTAVLSVPAPAIDGVYYGQGSGGNTYYGFDATTNKYIEYTVGQGINVLLFDQPNPNLTCQPLGYTVLPKK